MPTKYKKVFSFWSAEYLWTENKYEAKTKSDSINKNEPMPSIIAQLISIKKYIVIPKQPWITKTNQT